MPPMQKDAELIKLGKRIREVRTEKGLTQLQLAHAIGKDQQSVQRLETGNVNPTIFYLLEIVKGLGVTLEVLFKDYE